MIECKKANKGIMVIYAGNATSHVTEKPPAVFIGQWSRYYMRIDYVLIYYTYFLPNPPDVVPK